MTKGNPIARPTRYVRLSEADLSFAYHSGHDGETAQYAPWQVRQHTSLGVNLREAKDTEPLLALPAERTEVLVGTPATAMPLADFTEELCEPTLHFVMPAKAGERVFYDTLPAVNCVLVYAMPEETCKALEEAFGEVHFTACLTHVLRHYSRTRCQEDAARRMLIHLHESSADIAAFEGRRMLVENSFEVHQASDVAYYAYHIASTLGFDARQDTMDLCGDKGSVEEALRFIHMFSPQACTLEQFEGMPYDLACMTGAANDIR
ncbi:MAG: DUF3822 family protein [Alloprevotella sp.]|nr:DUF3822 family protein [Alloprevotella sp.]